MSAVHLDWHLATWAQGLAGSGIPEALLADPRLHPRLERIAARGCDLALLEDVPDDVRIVLDWFGREAPEAIFHRLGLLRHAAAWGERLVTSGGKGVPDWVGLEEIKGALKLLQGLPEAAALRSHDRPDGPDAVSHQGQALVAGWWAALDPTLAATAALVCAAPLSADLPKPGLPEAVCLGAVLAAARSAVGTVVVAEQAAEHPDAMSEGAFDD